MPFTPTCGWLGRASHAETLCRQFRKADDGFCYWKTHNDFQMGSGERKTSPNSNLEFHYVSKMSSPLQKLKIVSTHIQLFEILTRLSSG